MGENQIAGVPQDRLDRWADAQHERLTEALEAIDAHNYGTARDLVERVLEDGPVKVPDLGYIDWRFWPTR